MQALIALSRRSREIDIVERSHTFFGNEKLVHMGSAAPSIISPWCSMPMDTQIERNTVRKIDRTIYRIDDSFNKRVLNSPPGLLANI